jgi:hypothetical protein
MMTVRREIGNAGASFGGDDGLEGIVKREDKNTMNSKG